MKTLPGLLACLLLAAIAYPLATGMIDSFYTYSTPLNAQPPAPGDPTGPAATRRLVFVLIDALRYDTAMDSAVMPELDRLRALGASARMHSRPPSFSMPGWVTLLTGAWPDINSSPAFNVDYEDILPIAQDHLFAAAHAAGLKTAISGYYWFEKMVPQEMVTVSFYTPGEDAAADRQVVDAALPWLDDPSYQFVLIHLDQVDYAGHHEGGPRDSHWAAAAQRVDGQLAEIAARLDFTQDTLLIASDHGQIDAGGHGGHDPITLVEPFILVGKAVRPGTYPDVQMVDAAPTMAALLGLPLPAAAQGGPVTAMLELPFETTSSLPMALKSQQYGLLTGYRHAIQSDPSQMQGSSIDDFQAAISQARASRAGRERLPRIAIALLLALAPLPFFLRTRHKLWTLIAAGVYLLLFHARHALITRRAYSFSSIQSPTEIVLYCVIGVAIAFLAALTLYAWRTRLLHEPPAAAIRRVTGLALITAWLAALPAFASFAWDGLYATWTLPDFALSYHALLALIQLLFIGIFGTLLAAISAALITTISRILK